MRVLYASDAYARTREVEDGLPESLGGDRARVLLVYKKGRRMSSCRRGSWRTASDIIGSPERTTQTPPIWEFLSTIATRYPRFTASMAHFCPAGPEPITIWRKEEWGWYVDESRGWMDGCNANGNLFTHAKHKVGIVVDSTILKHPHACAPPLNSFDQSTANRDATHQVVVRRGWEAVDAAALVPPRAARLQQQPAPSQGSCGRRGG